ncbi:MAG: hypothetical protein ACTTJE_04350 [Schwartzia sp. (in: firmicutes)]
MAGEGAGQAPAAKGKRGWLLVGAAFFFLGAALWLFYRPAPPAVSVPPRSAVGIVDVREVLRAHPAYSALSAQRAERQRMEDDLFSERQMILALTAPRLSSSLFQDAARQKQHQRDVAEENALRERLAAAEKARREELKPALEAARDEINGQYFNEIFNLQLKLDNRDTMRLSDETVRLLSDRLHALQQERGQKQFALWRRFEDEIVAYRATLAEKWGLDLAEERAVSKERLSAEALRRKAEAESRNAETLRQSLMALAERRARLAEKEAALAAKAQEISAMEEYMMKDVASKAAKLAVMHHLDIIFAHPAKNIAALPAGLVLPIGAWPAEHVSVVRGDALLLTDELAAELKGH